MLDTERKNEMKTEMKTEGDKVFAQPAHTVKLGEYVRRSPDAKKTYRRGAWDASSKRYSLIDCDDTNRELFVKRLTLLFTGFTY